MSGALEKIKKQFKDVEMYNDLMEELDSLREEHERTNDLLEKILEEVRGLAD